MISLHKQNSHVFRNSKERLERRQEVLEDILYQKLINSLIGQLLKNEFFIVIVDGWVPIVAPSVLEVSF